MSTPSPFQSPATVQSLTRWDEDPGLYLFTSLTAGSSHIITATARIGTILKASQIPYVAVDTATDESARKLWGRRSKGRKLPGLVKEGFVIADLEEVEEWNEFGELEDNIGPVPDPSTTSTTAGTGKPLNTSSSTGTASTAAASKSSLSSEVPAAEKATSISGSSMKLPIRQLANEVAEKATLKNTAKTSKISMSTTKENDPISGENDGGTTKVSNLKSDEESDEKPEKEPKSTPGAKAIADMAPNSNPSSTPAAAIATSPTTEDKSKNKIESSKESKDIPSNPENDHESSSVPKSEHAQGTAADESENKEKSKQSSTDEGDEATIPSNSEKAQPDLKRDVAEMDDFAGSKESKEGTNQPSKDANKDSEEGKEKGNKIEADAKAEAEAEDETIRPQVQDPKSGEAAGVSNMD